jgi:hypothetical protein
LNYSIKATRSVKDGVLTFTGDGKIITTKCYWDTAKKIPAGTYTGCSATTMARKRNSKGTPREAIFIPNVKGYSEIFIHMGKFPYERWSDGCIVIDESKIIEIYGSITPKNGHNVTVMTTG